MPTELSQWIKNDVTHIFPSAQWLLNNGSVLALTKRLGAGTAELYVPDENLFLLEGSYKTKAPLDAQNFSQSRQSN